MEGFNTPILFIIFNRLDTTEKVFEEIRKQKPKYLYVAADGPRKNREDDIINCKKTRAIIEKIDWECELKTLFRDENLGCGKAVSGAITWFFENVEMGIILEDDCLPHQDFFPYCEDLLERYKNNEKIKIISGDNFQNKIKRGNASYYFSAYSHIWGWASWRRVWKEYDYTLDSISEHEFKLILKKYFSNFTEQQVWLDKFISSKKGFFNTWDFQLSFCIWKNNGLSIIPNENLISNIGFGDSSTHTYDSNNKLAKLPTNKILPVQYARDSFVIDYKADKFSFNFLYKKNILQIFYRIINRNIKWKYTQMLAKRDA